ncbi:MAG: hypothetical protein ACKOGA_17475 [Planctomycetaceae bacterium]
MRSVQRPSPQAVDGRTISVHPTGVTFNSLADGWLVANHPP